MFCKSTQLFSVMNCRENVIENEIIYLRFQSLDEAYTTGAGEIRSKQIFFVITKKQTCLCLKKRCGNVWYQLRKIINPHMAIEFPQNQAIFSSSDSSNKTCLAFCFHLVKTKMRAEFMTTSKTRNYHNFFT